MRGEELLIQYIESGLSPKERFELEKLTLDDAFLADAYEGITGPDSKQSALIIDRIRKRLDEQKVKDKVIPMYRKLWPYAVAASLIFVASVGILLKPGSDVTSYAQEANIETYDNASVAEAMETSVIKSKVVDESEAISAQEDISINLDADDALAVQLEKGQGAQFTDEASSQNGISLNIDDLSNRKSKKEILAVPRASAKEISLSRKAPLENSNSISDLLSSQVASVETSDLENAPIPNIEAISSDPILNGLSDAKLRALPQGEKPVPIPNGMELADVDIFEKGRALKALESIKEEVTSEIYQDIERSLIEDFSLKRSEFSLSDETTAYLDSAPVLGENVVIKLNPQLPAQAFAEGDLMIATYNESSDTLDYDSVKQANDAYRNGDFEGAIAHYKQAIEQEKDYIQKAKHHFSIAFILFRRLKQYEKAREQATIASEINLNWGAPYTLIGDMYTRTAGSCGDAWNQKLAILAAVDKYEKAISIEPSVAESEKNKVRRYQSSYPTKEEGFMRGIKAGDTVKVGCWINENVVVRFK